MFDWLTSELAATAATVGGFLGQQDTNAVNRQIAAENTAFQERMSNTAYQRQVKDMEAAGLNPMLAYVKGGGASTPTGSITQVQNPYAAGVQSGESAARSYLAQKQAPKAVAETRNVTAQTENVGVDTIKKRAETLLIQANERVAGVTADEKRAHINVLEHQAHKIVAEVKNIPVEGDRLAAVIRQLNASIPLINTQAKTEEQRNLQMSALAVKTLYEADLLKYDLDAIDLSGNLGKDFGQFKPIIDTVMSIVRILKR